MNDMLYDTAIIGGGLAGLTLSIKLAQAGHAVILFEKEEYPFHKVCGEYISFESWDYLQSLGLPLKHMCLPVIDKLIVTAPSGKILHAELSPGGFGISRYRIDNELKRIANEKGVLVLDNCKAEDIVFREETFYVQTQKGLYRSKVCCGSFGKRSNIDVKWKRPFISRNKKLSNYVGVKYHVEANTETGTIALHNFKDGYCGISRIEDGRYCLCYLTNANNLKESGSIEKMEQDILSVNPHLKKIFDNSRKLYSQPLSISQISFDKKSQVENHVLLVGDAAGMITPLCGNGMSMAMHGGKIAAGLITKFLDGSISRKEMEACYTAEWKNQFGKRLKAGRIIQRFFGKVWVTNVFISTMKKLPWLTKKIIGLTHGKSF